MREPILAIAEKSGFVPNVFLALAHRPDELRAFMAYHDALMDRSDGLSKAEREMIVVATSGANDCLYCVVAHGAIVRIRAKRPLLADQLATNPHSADLTERERHIVRFALRVANDAAAVTDHDLTHMRDLGFTADRGTYLRWQDPSGSESIEAPSFGGIPMGGPTLHFFDGSQVKISIEAPFGSELPVGADGSTVDWTAAAAMLGMRDPSAPRAEPGFELRQDSPVTVYVLTAPSAVR